MRHIILREFHMLEHTLSNRELLSEKAFLTSGAQASARSVAAQSILVTLVSDTVLPTGFPQGKFSQIPSS